MTVCALYAQFSEDQNTIFKPRCHLFSINTIARCNMKYRILKYFDIYCSLGRNGRLSGVGSKNCVLKKLIIFVFSCTCNYFTILARL